MGALLSDVTATSKAGNKDGQAAVIAMSKAAAAIKPAATSWDLTKKSHSPPRHASFIDAFYKT
jgi:hypothetical protein